MKKKEEKKEEKKDNLFSVIKYEGDNSTFVWKYPKEDFLVGSQLIVHESQEALFFRDGKALDLFGAGRYTLETQRIPLLSGLYDKPFNADEVFHSEIYFINMVTQMAIKWGTDSKIGVFDPISGMHLQLGACGEFSIRVNSSRKLLIKLVGTTSGLNQNDLFSMNGINGYFKSIIMTKVKSYIGNVIKENQLNILEIDSKLEELSAGLKEKFIPILNEYGLDMPQFFITRIVLPEDDPNFRRMRQQYADKYLVVQEEHIRKMEVEAAKERKEVEAETAARLKIISTQGNAEALKIQKQAEAEAYKMQAEAEATEMKMKGYSYQQETSRMVGMEAMQNGLGGGENGASSLGQIAGLGMGLGAMGGVMNITRDAISPIIGQSEDIGKNIGNSISDSWNCQCGRQGITSLFCPDCGAKRLNIEKSRSWDCTCGRKGIKSKFCPDCGRPKMITWDCICGEKNIQSKFCPNCGKERPE